MLKTIGEWLKRKYGPTFPVWIVAISALFCCVIIGLSFGLSADEEPAASKLGVLAMVAEVAKIIVTAIVAGAVLKVIAVQGYFEEALVNIAYGDKGVDSMGEIRQVKLWKELTCRIYAPLLLRGRDDDDLKSLYKRMMDALGSRIEYRQAFYIESISRDLTFCWKDRENKVILVKDYMEAVVVPFVSNEPVEWKTYRQIPSENSLEDYTTEDKRYSFEGEDVSKRSVVIDASGKIESTAHFLRGKSRYEINRTRKQGWKLTGDPILGITSPYVIGRGTFKITNELSGCEVIFQQLGGATIGDELFEPIEGADRLAENQVLRRRVSKVLLPHQGFQAIMVET